MVKKERVYWFQKNPWSRKLGPVVFRKVIARSLNEAQQFLRDAGYDPPDWHLLDEEPEFKTIRGIQDTGLRGVEE